VVKKAVSSWEAYKMGKKARLEGKPRSACPFEDLLSDWIQGWNDENAEQLEAKKRAEIKQGDAAQRRRLGKKMKRKYQQRQQRGLFFCAACQRWLPPTKFATLKSGPHRGYVQSQCKDCRQRKRKKKKEKAHGR
jgi:ribosome modulation factor